TGIIASAASSLTGHLSVGASGAIFGVAGALIFSILRSPRYRHERWLRGIVTQLVVLLPANLLVGAFIPVIDNTAHLGGLASGLLLGLLPHREPPPPPGEQVIDVQSQRTEI